MTEQTPEPVVLADQVLGPRAMVDRAPDPGALHQGIFQEKQVLCWKTEVIITAKFFIQLF
jgi:hypothetical protein